MKAQWESAKVEQQFKFLHYILPKKFTLQIYYSSNADSWWFTAQCKHCYNALYEGIYTVYKRYIIYIIKLQFKDLMC